MHLTVVIVAIALTTAAQQGEPQSAQPQSGDQAPVPPAMTVQRPAPVNCIEISGGASCSMFNEMLAVKDEELDFLQSDFTTSYVCFENDQFFVLRFDKPLSGAWKKSATGAKSEGMEEQNGRILFESFKNGVSDAFRMTIVEWTRWPGSDASALNKAKQVRKDYAKFAIITNAEIEFRFDFENLAHSVTTRDITIRRSTLRFVDNLRAPGDKTGHVDSWDSAGYCSLYPKTGKTGSL
jgi:hypothetical protein